MEVHRGVRKEGIISTIVDSGAARWCIWINQARALAETEKKDRELRKFNFALKFGNIVHQSQGKIKVSIPTLSSRDMTFSCVIVPADILVLLGLNVIIRERLMRNVRDLEIELDDSSPPMKIRNNNLAISSSWRKKVVSITETNKTWKGTRKYSCYTQKDSAKTASLVTP